MTDNLDQRQAADRAADIVTRISGLYRVQTSGVAVEPRHTFTCHRCKRSWHQERAAPPSLCPFCGYARWNEPPEVRTCVRCGRIWNVPTGHPHGKCPNCHSRLWDTPSRREGKPLHNG